eukprot:gene7197-9162_t
MAPVRIRLAHHEQAGTPSSHIPMHLSVSNTKHAPLIALDAYAMSLLL